MADSAAMSAAGSSTATARRTPSCPGQPCTPDRTDRHRQTTGRLGSAPLGPSPAPPPPRTHPYRPPRWAKLSAHGSRRPARTSAPSRPRAAACPPRRHRPPPGRPLPAGPGRLPVRSARPQAAAGGSMAAAAPPSPGDPAPPLRRRAALRATSPPCGGRTARRAPRGAFGPRPRPRALIGRARLSCARQGGKGQV